MAVTTSSRERKLEPLNASRLEVETAGPTGGDAMAVQVVMDHTGDTRHWYDAADERSLFEARERFRQLSEQGYTAAVREAGGSSRIVRSFEPTAKETLFFPRLVGG
jgi:hypothetical protein